MPLSAPSPLDALRQYTRAVILTADGCALSDDLRAVTSRSGARCEFVDHPLLAIAALTCLERESKSVDRAALVVAERHIDDLGALFSTIRTRLQRIAIWVFESDIAIEVHRGQTAEPTEAARKAASPRESQAPAIGSMAPKLRITRPAEAVAAPPPPTDDLDPERVHEDPPGPSGNTVTPEELALLLNIWEQDDDPPPAAGGKR